MGNVAPDTPSPATQPRAQHYEDEVTLPTLPLATVFLDFKGPGLFGPDTGLGRLIHQLGVYLQTQWFNSLQHLHRLHVANCVIVFIVC